MRSEDTIEQSCRFPRRQVRGRSAAPFAAAVVGVLLMIGGCAGTQPAEESSDEAERPVHSAPVERDEPPVWAEGPVGSEEEVPKRSNEGARPKRRERRKKRRRRRKRRPEPDLPEGLAGVFPDETVTLDFRKARISRIMRIFQVKATVDIVLDPKVKGRMTVSLEDAPIEKAFRALLQGAKLTFERREGVVVVKPREVSEPDESK